MPGCTSRKSLRPASFHEARRIASSYFKELEVTSKSAGSIDEVKKLRQANGYSNASIHVSQALGKFTSYYTDAVHSRLFARRRPRDLGQKMNRAHRTRLRGRFALSSGLLR